MTEGNRRVLEHRGSPTLEAFKDRGEDLRPPPTPGCKDCRLIAELCGNCEAQIALMGKERPSFAMEADALTSILRVLEPLTHEQRVRCIAAAVCMFNLQAARRVSEEVG